VKIYVGFWTLKVKYTQRVLWTSGLQKCKRIFFKVGCDGQQFSVRTEKLEHDGFVAWQSRAHAVWHEL